MRAEDIFTKLPCPDTHFDDNMIPDMPLLDNGIVDPKMAKSSATLGGLGYLAQITALSGEVSVHIYRSKRRSAEDYRHTYENLYSSLPKRLHEWSASLPCALQYSVPNLVHSNKAGFVGLFVTLHAIRHTTILRLHRYVRPDCLGTAAITRNICRARESAKMILDMVLALNEVQHDAFGASFPAYALIAAFDVLSAGGSVATLPPLISTFLTAARPLDELSTFWASAKHQRRLLQRRVEELAQITDGSGPGSLTADGRYWTVDESLESYASKDSDVIYGVDRALYFEVLFTEENL